MTARPLWHPEISFTPQHKEFLDRLRRDSENLQRFILREQAYLTTLKETNETHSAQLISSVRQRLEESTRELDEVNALIEKWQTRPLSSWEKLLPEDLRARFWDPSYLPTLAEADLIRPRLGEFANDTGDHELLTREFIQALADEMEPILRNILRSIDETCVLEIGAGSGRLTHFLSEEIGRRLSDLRATVRWQAVDIGTEYIPPVFPVERASATFGLLKYQPTIVLASWPRMDVAALIRELSMPVQAIVLMGEPGICGGGEDGRWQKADGYRQTVLHEVTRTERGATDGNAFFRVGENPPHKTVTSLFELSDSATD